MHQFLSLKQVGRLIAGIQADHRKTVASWRAFCATGARELIQKLGRDHQDKERELDILQAKLKKAKEARNETALRELGSMTSLAQRSCGLAQQTLTLAKERLRVSESGASAYADAAEQILALHHVAALTFQEHTLYAYTDAVKIQGLDAYWYEIGFFRIALPLLSSPCPFTVDCLHTTHTDGVAHPAGVFEDMCNLKHTITGILGTHGPVPALHYLIGAVHSANQYQEPKLKQWKRIKPPERI